MDRKQHIDGYDLENSPLESRSNRYELASNQDSKPVSADNGRHREEVQADLLGVEQMQTQARRISLAGWLGIDPNGLNQLSEECLNALTDGIEQSRKANTTIEAQQLELDRIKKTADTDYLTGIGNRRSIEGRLETEWGRALRHGRPLAVLMVDIDSLKLINDIDGHPSGDLVITEVAHRLVSSVRGEDTVGRIGGDEYMIVCPDTDLNAARVIARKLTRRIANQIVEIETKAISVHVSIGWASTSTQCTSGRALVRAADVRLYKERAKQSRLRVAVYR